MRTRASFAGNDDAEGRAVNAFQRADAECATCHEGAGIAAADDGIDFFFRRGRWLEPSKSLFSS